MGASRCAAPSNSISSIGIGIRMVTLSTPRSKELCFTCSSTRATANFSRAQNRIATFPRSESIRRLCRKHLATTIRAKIDNHGRDEALFQEIAAALGYKENKLPFTLIAQRFSLKTLRKNLDDAEALLFGLAGFLETPDLAIYKKSAKNYVRDLWDRWWPHRDRLQRLILPAKIWKLSSTRPVNYPQRRLAALAILGREWPAFRRSLGKVRAGLAIINSVTEFFETLDHPFWKTRYTVTADASPEPMALVGESRVADILAHAIFPFWLPGGPGRAGTKAE